MSYSQSRAMRTGQAPRSTKVRIDHIHACTQEECLISENEKYIKQIVAPEQEKKGELGCLGRFVKFSVVWVTMYMYQVLHPDMCIYIYLSVTSHINCIVARCLINVVYLTACCLQVLMTLHFLSDVANDAESALNQKLRHYR